MSRPNIGDLAKQNGIDSLILTIEDLGDIPLSSEYISGDRISLVWRAKSPYCIHISGGKSALQLGVTYALEKLIRDKITKMALMKNCRIDDYGEDDFAYEDFLYPLSIEFLCRTIKDDFPELVLPFNDYSLNCLNQVLRTPNFFALVKMSQPTIAFPKTISTLIEIIQTFSDKNYASLSLDERNLVRKLNKLLLRKLYPNKISKKKEGSPLDAHHNILVVDNFKSNSSLRSHVAEVTWMGYDKSLIKFSVKNLSRKVIPIGYDSVYLIDIDNNILKCSNVNYVPTGWISPIGNFDLLKGITAKVILKCEGLNEDTTINHFIYKQCFYIRNGWYSAYSVFDFQLAESEDG